MSKLSECRVVLRRADRAEQGFPVEVVTVTVGGFPFDGLIPKVPPEDRPRFSGARVAKVEGTAREARVWGYSEDGIPTIVLDVDRDALPEVPAWVRITYRDRASGELRDAICGVGTKPAPVLGQTDLCPIFPSGVTKADVIVYEYTPFRGHPAGLDVPGEATFRAATARPTSRIEIRCTACGEWFNSWLVMEGGRTFDSSTLEGNTADCPRCGARTPCNKENMRAKLDDGGFRGSDTV